MYFINLYYLFMEYFEGIRKLINPKDKIAYNQYPEALFVGIFFFLKKNKLGENPVVV